MMQQVHLDLICDQREGKERLEIFHLEPVLVGDAEMEDLAGRAELFERLGDFFSFPKTVRPVQEKNLQPIGSQPAKNGIDTF